MNSCDGPHCLEIALQTQEAGHSAGDRTAHQRNGRLEMNRKHRWRIATEQLISACGIRRAAATPEANLSALGDNLRLNRAKAAIITGRRCEIAAHLCAVGQAETSSDDEHAVGRIERAGKRMRTHGGL